MRAKKVLHPFGHNYDLFINIYTKLDKFAVSGEMVEMHTGRLTAEELALLNGYVVNTQAYECHISQTLGMRAVTFDFQTGGVLTMTRFANYCSALDMEEKKRWAC